jgi:hypothetical protein
VLTILDKRTSFLDVVHCNRFRRGTPYAIVAKTVISRVSGLKGEKTLAIDMGGVGMSCAEAYQNCPFKVVHMTFTGGRVPTYEGREWHVPKFHVISIANMEISEKRVRIAKGIRDSQGLITELAGYTMKMTTMGNATFSNNREVGYDDRVTSLCTAIFMAVKERQGGRNLSKEPTVEQAVWDGPLEEPFGLEAGTMENLFGDEGPQREMYNPDTSTLYVPGSGRYPGR